MLAESPETSASPAQPSSRPSRWSQWLLFGFGAILVVVGGGALLLRTTKPAEHVTGKVLSTLEPAEYVQAAPGCLKDWNVLILTLDTTRADHLGCYGHRGVRTPTYDALAQGGILFSQAITSAPATLPAHSSLLTGLDAPNHGVRANGTYRLAPSNVTLAEVLRENGYATAAAVSAYVLDKFYGLGQGFDLYNDDLTRGISYAPNMYRERASELTNESIIPWLREHGKEKFFCWLHYFDAHAVYLPPEPFRTDYAADLYSGEIAYADSQFARVLETLREMGVLDRTLIIVTSDHGEGLGEHNEETHSLLVYDSTLHIPLIMSAPGKLPAGKVVNRQVGLVDVMPTVLDLLGIDAGRKFDGVSLIHPLPPAPRNMYMETLATMLQQGWAPLQGIRNEDYKYILAPRPEIYDLRKDPHELTNLYPTQPELGAKLHDQLVALIGKDSIVSDQVETTVALDEDSREKLAALGYIIAAPTNVEAASTQPRMDPKDGILHWTKVQAGINLRDAGQIKPAIDALEKCIETVPMDVFARSVLAGALATYGEFPRALQVIDEAHRLAPTDNTLSLARASILLGVGRFDDAEAQVRAVLTDDPASSAAHSLLASLCLARERYEEALGYMQKALELDRGSRRAQIYRQMGDYHQRRGELDKARKCFEDAVNTDAFYGDALAGLAELDVADGKYAEATERLRQAIKFNPVQPRALAVLCDVLSHQGRHDEAIRSAERALELSPRYGVAYVSLGVAYRRKDDFAKAEETYKKGIEISPRTDALHQNLAQLYLRQGKTEEAAEEFRQAVRLNRFNFVALSNLGVYHMTRKEPVAAYRFLRAALQVNPSYAVAHKQIAALFIERRRYGKAMFHLERSLDLDPKQAEAGQMRFELERIRRMAPASQPEEPEEPPDLGPLPLDPPAKDS